MKDNSQLINKLADNFTDTFAEQITNYLIAYDVEVTDANINKVIKEIVRIYNNKEQTAQDLLNKISEFLANGEPKSAENLIKEHLNY